MDHRSSNLPVFLNRRQMLIAAGVTGMALVLDRQIEVRGAATTPTAVSATETPVESAAGEQEPTPIGGAVGMPKTSPVASPEASPAASPAAVFDASMQSLKFLPQEIRIPVGTTVVWTNKDTVTHTVTQRAKPEDQIFSSPMIPPGGSFSFTFEKPGTYPYFCMPHPFMTGTVVVS